MKKLTPEQEKEALTNALKSLKFDEKYFIKDLVTSKEILYTIGCYYLNEDCIVDNIIKISINKTDYMTYKEMQKWFLGYMDGIENRFNK